MEQRTLRVKTVTTKTKGKTAGRKQNVQEIGRHNSNFHPVLKGFLSLMDLGKKGETTGWTAFDVKHRENVNGINYILTAKMSVMWNVTLPLAQRGLSHQCR